jgi:rRNA-processing protein FCF1
VSEKHEIEFTVAVDDAQRTRLADPDFEIIDAARAIGDLSGKPTVIATSDTAMRFRARAAGVTARAMDVVTARG